MTGRPTNLFAVLFRRPIPLRWHLVLLVVGTLLPVVVFAAAMAHQIAKHERAAAERRLVQSARDLATTLDREISGSHQILSALAESDRLDRGDLAGFHGEAKRVARTQPGWLSLLLLAPDGRQLVNTALPWGTPLGRANEPESLRRTFETGQPTVGNLVRGGRERRLAFPIRMPVVRDGEVRYVLTAAMRPEALAEVVNRQQLSRGEEWTRTVIDERGVAVARTRSPEKFVGLPVPPSFLRRIRTSPEGLYRETSMDRASVYAAYRRSRLSNWTVAVAVPVEVVEGPARRSMAVVASSGLGLLLLSGLGAFVLSRHLSRSIESAASGAATLAHGGRPSFEPSMVAEAARLAEALEASADLLIQRQRELNDHLAHAEAAREDAEGANRAKDEFLAMLGHELRNPLGPIRNGVYLLREILPPDEKVKRVREMIERQLAHITRLVDDLLDASRISQGKVVLKKEVIDLRRVVQEVEDDFKPSFDQARIGLSLSLPDTPVWVQADATRLAQAVGNLLHNALKFTPEEGWVSLSVAVEGGVVRLDVQDDGGGIDPAFLPRLFDPFSQGLQSLDRSKGGLGLGLALVKGLAELHGGTVEAASDGLGQGARFTLRLPLATQRPLSSQVPSQVPGASGLGVSGLAARRRVLLVEDNEDAAESLSLLLSLQGHDVKVALSGHEALAIAPGFTPEVVICDIGLPDLDGYALCEKLRELPGLEETRFVALTGYGQAEDVRRAHAAGFAVHFTKPVDPNLLAEVLSEPLPRERQRRATG